jgi:hypothetical protein
MFSQILRPAVRRACLIAAITLLLPVSSLAQPQQTSNQGYQKKVSPQGMLDLALYYYNNDDTTGKAEESFKRLLTRYDEQTPQYETAQYYLAAYYQRKFYLMSAKGERDLNALRQAATEYRKYTDQFYKQGKHTWLSDAFFNLAIVNLQLGEPWKAVDELSKMKDASGIDPTVYIYQVVWSSQSGSVIDAYLPATRLGDYTASLVMRKDYEFERALVQIQKWCQSQR